MVFTYPQFEVQLERSIESTILNWPKPGEAMNDSSLGCNRNYMDLRGLTWSEARRVYSLEEELITRIEASANPEDEYDVIEDELYEDPEGMYGLDIGVASPVISLSAARCLPFSSCNAGAFGGSHHECYPLVAFFSRPEAISLLLDCAKEANTGLNQGDIGNLVVYADDIRNIRAFAHELISRSTDFRRLRFSKSKERSTSHTAQNAKQLDLL